MEVKSITKSARISPKKARDVAREIQGLPVSDALDALTYTPRKAAFLIGKTLKSAIANAENNHDLVPDTLVVKIATVTEGPSFKRFKPRARGSASAIKKRTSHINIVLTDEVSLEEPRSKSKKETAAPKKAAPKAEAKAPKADAAPAGDEAALGQVYKEAPAEVDDLKKISGVGPVLETKLNEQGIYKYEQITKWTPENIVAFDERLAFKGRIERDNWLEQATALFEEKYGNA